MVDVVVDPGARFARHAPVLVVGAGACGATAALAARAGGAGVLVVERDAQPAGSTARSCGEVPAAGTRAQRARGIDDSAEQFAADIQAQARGRAAPALVQAYTQVSATALDWLGERHGVEFDLLDAASPGHRVARLHAVDERTGAGLLARLHGALRGAGADLLTATAAQTLVVDESMRVRGARLRRVDGGEETIGCGALVLACGGFGANAALVGRLIPDLAPAPYLGHAGSGGDALAWGEALGAAFGDLSGCHGHGAVTQPGGVPIGWSLFMHGAVLVNARGERFCNEHDGPSEAAVRVLQQPGAVAFCVYDARQHDLGESLSGYAQAVAAGAVRRAGSVAELADLLGIEPAGLQRAIAFVNALALEEDTDEFGRRFRGTETLLAPYYGVRVTGGLLDTHGGLATDARCRVLTRRGRPLPNLFAAGSAARGVSGDRPWGYLPGNGLLAALAGGFIAGREAAALVRAGG